MGDAEKASLRTKGGTWRANTRDRGEMVVFQPRRGHAELEMGLRLDEVDGGPEGSAPFVGAALEVLFAEWKRADDRWRGRKGRDAVAHHGVGNHRGRGKLRVIYRQQRKGLMTIDMKDMVVDNMFRGGGCLLVSCLPHAGFPQLTYQQVEKMPLKQKQNTKPLHYYC